MNLVVLVGPPMRTRGLLMSLEQIAKFREQVDLGYIREVRQGDLILFNYTDKCTYDKAWNEYTRAARGIIFNEKTGAIVARPFPKFFNLGEMPETYLTSLPDEPYEVYEKVDGSLGIIYFYDNEWRVATRGSFSSEQAIKATELLKKYKFDDWADTFSTFLVEIIYPENKIVVDYGAEERLVLLGAVDTRSGDEIPLYSIEEVALLEGLTLAEQFIYGIEEMIELQKTLPKDQEGFVIRFKSGLRLKIKGHEYLKIHKIISNLSPLSFWEAMEAGIVKNEYLSQVPEEYTKDFEPIVTELSRQYREVWGEIMRDAEQLPACNWKEKDGLRAIGLFLKNHPTAIKHPSAIFPWVTNNPKALEKYIMKAIRPTNNVLREAV